MQRIERCKAGLTVFEFLNQNVSHVPEAVDYDDILRAQWTNCVSAFDTLLHDIIHDLMVDSFSGRRNRTKKFELFTFTILEALEIFKTPTPIESHEIFSRFIQSKLSKESYQNPKKVADGLALVWDEEHKWKKIAELMGHERSHVVTTLKLITDRRNMIVHESDFDPTDLCYRSIEVQEVNDVIDFVESCGLAIWDLTRLSD